MQWIPHKKSGRGLVFLFLVLSLFSKWIYYSCSLQVILDWGVASLQGNEKDQASRKNALESFASRNTQQTLLSQQSSHSFTKGLAVYSLIGFEVFPLRSC